jgi:hypothetical protein
MHHHRGSGIEGGVTAVVGAGRVDGSYREIERTGTGEDSYEAAHV